MKKVKKMQWVKKNIFGVKNGYRVLFRKRLFALKKPFLLGNIGKKRRAGQGTGENITFISGRNSCVLDITLL